WSVTGVQTCALPIFAEFIIDLEEAEEKLTEGKEAVLPRLREDPHYRLVESAIKEMEWWAWYRESDYEEDEEDEFRELSVEEMMEIGRASCREKVESG